MSGDFTVVRHPTARRIRLAIDPATGEARLVVPRRAGVKAALAWAEGKAGWLAEQRARLPQPRPFDDGAALPVADEVLTIRWDALRRSRTVRREGDLLVTGGPIDTLPKRIEAWLKRTALDLLTAETRKVAAQAGVEVTRVGIGDARGRWGSCASSGAIRYSWRLILAPGYVRRSTVAHEVAHRVHMDHSPAFYALATMLDRGEGEPARAWLRTHGATLHWFGRSS